MPTLYFFLGQAGWFACVLGAAHGEAWIGIAVTSLLIMLHLLRVPRPIEEIKLVTTVMVLGGIWESVMVVSGLLDYPGGKGFDGLAPLWLLALWASFAAQVNTTYRWLKPRIPLAVLFGAVAGPLSFRAGAELHAVRFEKPWPAAVALALGWAVLLPVIIGLSRRWDGVRRDHGVSGTQA